LGLCPPPSTFYALPHAPFFVFHAITVRIWGVFCKQQNYLVSKETKKGHEKLIQQTETIFILFYFL
jgi:hypothetical protein